MIKLNNIHQILCSLRCVNTENQCYHKTLYSKPIQAPQLPKHILQKSRTKSQKLKAHTESPLTHTSPVDSSPLLPLKAPPCIAPPKPRNAAHSPRVGSAPRERRVRSADRPLPRGEDAASIRDRRPFMRRWYVPSRRKKAAARGLAPARERIGSSGAHNGLSPVPPGARGRKMPPRGKCRLIPRGVARALEKAARGRGGAASTWPALFCLRARTRCTAAAGPSVCARAGLRSSGFRRAGVGPGVNGPPPIAIGPGWTTARLSRESILAGSQ